MSDKNYFFIFKEYTIMNRNKRDKYLNIYSWFALAIYLLIPFLFPGNRSLEIFGASLSILYVILRLIFRFIDKIKD